MHPFCQHVKLAVYNDVLLFFFSYVCRLLKKFDYPSMKFSIYFMSYERPEDIPEDETEKLRFLNTRRGTIELTQYVKEFYNEHW